MAGSGGRRPAAAEARGAASEAGAGGGRGGHGRRGRGTRRCDGRAEASPTTWAEKGVLIGWEQAGNYYLRAVEDVKSLFLHNGSG